MEETHGKAKKGLRDRRVHMANERTFLAWIRTSIAIMAFGFVVEKFSLFVRQLEAYLGAHASPMKTGYSPVIGIVIVVLGIVLAISSFWRFKIVERQIIYDTYQPPKLQSFILLLAVFLVGAVLVYYLIRGI
jgi:putative membrane protein